MFPRLATYAKVFPPDFKQRLLFIFPENRIIHVPFSHSGIAPSPGAQLAVLPPKKPDVDYRFDEEIERTIYEAKDLALENATQEAEARIAKIQTLLSQFIFLPIEDSSRKFLMEADVLTARAFLTSQGLEESVKLMDQAVFIKRSNFGNTSPEFTNIMLEKALMYLQYKELSKAETIFNELLHKFVQKVSGKNISENIVILNLVSTKLLLNPVNQAAEANKLLQYCLRTCHPNDLLVHDVINHNLLLTSKLLSSPSHSFLNRLPIFPQMLSYPAFR